MRLNYGRTVLLGSAFFGVQVLFAVYNAYVPILLQSGRADFVQADAVEGGFGLGVTLTGLIMTLDNLAALLILPYVGALSDATDSSMGKRKPYILLGAPIAALAFAAIPLLLGQPLWVFMLVIIVMILAIDIIRTPIIALMPDITPSPLRSQANGVINFMGGFGAVVAFLVGGVLYRSSTVAPFWFAAVILLAACLLVVFWLPVPVAAVARGASGLWQQVRAAMGNREANFFHDLRAIWNDRDRSPLYLLVTIFCLFLAYSALTVFFTSFAVVTLQVGRGQEAQLLSFFALAIVVFAVPAGLLGARIGRKRALMIGMAILIVVMPLIAVSTSLALIGGLLVVTGIGWSLIVVNAFPMVLDSASPLRLGRSGAYTGLYFLATQSAEVIGPVLVGGFLDLTGRNYRFMFVYTLIVVVVALATLTRVRRGESSRLMVDGEVAGT